MKNVKKLLRIAERPAKDARKLHPFYRGKIEIIPKCRIRDFNDFAVWYTPGVASVCRDIQKTPELVNEFTNKWNTIAIVTDGSRVLGLGDIGPEAGLPVMEGKALLFKYLGGVDAFPICLGTKDQESIISTVKFLQPSFGGINLEDIEQPKCFPILSRLRSECKIPVWHDDQQGTALVTLAGLINALKIVGKKIHGVRIVLVGAGAANICISRLLMNYGANPGKIIMTDSKGTLHKGRTELEGKYPEKWEMCQITNGEQLVGGIPEALDGADVVIALSTPGPGIIKKEWVSKMAGKAIVFTCANPTPEIWPWEAKEAGAAVVATGRSDFPNQVNNSLGFPGVFRGTLDVRASTITDEMCITAAVEIANCIKPGQVKADKLLPTMDDWEIYPRVAAAVGTKAIELGIAGHKMSKTKIYEQAMAMIKRSRNITKMMMQKGLIKSHA
jgi:malate dehydrogenase (oxaloacetate-decarboxylating)